MTPRENRVQRPLRRDEYELVFASSGAKKGWTDLKATIRGPLADTWDFLAKTPQERTPSNYPLRDSLSKVTYRGKTYDRWQHKPTLKGGARIWFFCDRNTVYLEKVFTAHPNPTKR